jgi:hypothetical protein
MEKPKIYCDTSLVINYMIAEGREPESQSNVFPESEYTKAEREFWEKLFRHDRKYNLATKLRSIVEYHFPNIELVISPFVLLELDGWYAEESFKRNALECTNVKVIQTYSQKQIGKYIKAIRDEAKLNRNSFASDVWRAIAGCARGESLAGIKIEKVDGLRFDKATFSKVAVFACLQIGMADIVHLLAADELKCTHFATTDSDFNRIKDEIESVFNFKLLFKDDILKIVKPR